MDTRRLIGDNLLGVIRLYDRKYRYQRTTYRFQHSFTYPTYGGDCTRPHPLRISMTPLLLLQYSTSYRYRWSSMFDPLLQGYRYYR